MDDHAPARLVAFAEKIRGALATLTGGGDAAELAELLSPDVIWGFCAGRADVLEFLDGFAAVELSDASVQVDVGDDRLISSVTIGSDADAPSVHQAMFIDDGMIVEICDALDRDHAERLQRVGPLAERAGSSVVVTAVAPVFPVGDIGAALQHDERLGFETRAYDGAPYGYADWETVSLHLTQVPELDPLTNTSAVYLFTNDADALFARWYLAGVEGRFTAPCDTDYGLREGAHIDPDGNLIRFGSSIEG